MNVGNIDAEISIYTIKTTILHPLEKEITPSKDMKKPPGKGWQIVFCYLFKLFPYLFKAFLTSSFFMPNILAILP